MTGFVCRWNRRERCRGVDDADHACIGVSRNRAGEYNTPLRNREPEFDRLPGAGDNAVAVVELNVVIDLALIDENAPVGSGLRGNFVWRKSELRREEFNRVARLQDASRRRRCDAGVAHLLRAPCAVGRVRRTGSGAEGQYGNEQSSHQMSIVHGWVSFSG